MGWGGAGFQRRADYPDMPRGSLDAQNDNVNIRTSLSAALDFQQSGW
jgi:hypothetical protein